MEQHLPQSARFPRGLVAAALVLWLLPGCAWLKEQTARTPSKVAADPERKAFADSKAGKKADAPVRLDGSAMGNGAPVAPNAPGFNGAQILATGSAAVDPTADPAAGLPNSADDKNRDETGEASPGAGPVVLAKSADREGREGGVVTAEDRDEENRSAKLRGTDDKPAISTADESLTNENSTLEFEGAGVKLKNGQVAATVNGQPIFVEDILRQLPLEVANQLARAEREFPPDQFRAGLRQIIARNLEQHVDRELLLQALKSKLKEDALKTIQKQIDAMYNTEYMPHAMKQAGVTTEAEFEQLLRKHGSSIEVLRTQFRNKELAQQYMGTKVLPKSGFDRPDVLKYYQEHKENYADPAQAKWEQIRLLFSNNGGKKGALEKAAKILERLENGEDFAALAKECSDGPTAQSKGGLRGWTTEGSLKDKELERALREQPVGEIGPPIEAEEAIEIIRVRDRTPSGYKSFPAVQEDIKAQLKNELWQKATKALIKDLREKATIEPFLDKL